ncbi:SHOCT domain-containing protein [Solicola gregarius]|uniref:SHOCT domain-containing protein n=1 Tax=Solicola gregarius TaxID=2908642 RepID=A0AA46YK18_9ACTN|nr:SHOCT domain-containing protein [Solicola gregarius]UYM04154.1 SHOCT domain-containing protein [Solicola gregarius]
MNDIIATGTTVLAENDHWDGPGPWWPIFPILWLLVIAGIVFAVTRFGRRGWHGGTHSGEARLGERYASGEIGEDEYRERLAVLRENRK